MVVVRAGRCRPVLVGDAVADETRDEFIVGGVDWENEGRARKLGWSWGWDMVGSWKSFVSCSEAREIHLLSRSVGGLCLFIAVLTDHDMLSNASFGVMTLILTTNEGPGEDRLNWKHLLL